LIDEYLRGGGNLLWLADPRGAEGWSRLESAIGVRLLEGTVVDSAPRMFGLEEPAFTLISEYPNHPVTAGLDGPTLFPLAAALEPKLGPEWNVSPLLTTLSRAWTETEPDDDAPTFDQALGERQGPLTIGTELRRHLPTGVQRVIIVGDGDFIANAYLGNGVNLQLGMNLFNWLTSESRSLDIVARSRPDTQLNFSEHQLVAIGALFLVLLPCALVACGMFSWWRRRNG